MRRNINGTNLCFPDEKNQIINIETVNLSSSEDNGLCIEPSSIEYSGNKGLVKGNIRFTPNYYDLDLDVKVNGIEWNKIDEILTDRDEDTEKGSETGYKWPFSGRIGIESGYFKYDEETFNAVKADIMLLGENVQIKINEAEICGIYISGSLDILPGRIALKINPSAKDQDLLNTLNCFSEVKTFLKGKYDLEGDIIAEGDDLDFPQKIEGELHFKAKAGRVYRFVMLAKIFSVMNLEEILRGDFPNLLQEGFPYKSITVDGHMKDNRFYLKSVIDNASMGISFSGYIDIKEKTLNLTVLVAPFKTVDFVIKRIPVLNEILDGTLISIPVKVTGSYLDPKIAVLDPDVVEEELLDIMQRTLNLPFTVIRPIFSNGEHNGQKILKKKLQKKQDKMGGSDKAVSE